jgi:hypothetical protein
MGDTERNTLIDRSSSVALWLGAEFSSAGLALMSAMMRTQLR